MTDKEKCQMAEEVPQKNIDRFGHSGDINGCSFSKSGLFATASSDQSTRLWRLSGKTGQLVHLFTLRGHSYPVNCCTFSPQGTLLATSSTDGLSLVWDVVSGEQLCSFPQPSGAAVRTCQFCPNSALLATAGDDDEVCLWNIGGDNSLVRRIQGAHDATIFALSFSPEGSILLSSDTLGRIQLWSTTLSHHSALGRVEEAHDLGVTALAFNSKFTHGALEVTFSVASCGNDGRLCGWTITTGVTHSIVQRIQVFAHEGTAMAVSFSSQGDLVATGGGDKLVKVWDSESFSCLRILESHDRYITSCAFSQNGLFLFSCSKNIKVWRMQKKTPDEVNQETAAFDENFNNRDGITENKFQLKLNAKNSTKNLIQCLDKHSKDVNCCDMYGVTLATGSADKQVRVWLFSRQEAKFVETEKSPLLGHTYSIYSVKFSNQRTLLSASLDGSVVMWNLETGLRLWEYWHQEGIGFRVARISPTCDTVVAGSDDDSAHLVHLSSEPKELGDNVLNNDEVHQLRGNTCDKVHQLRGHRNTVFAVDISDDGRFLATGCSGEILKIWNLCSTETDMVISRDEVHDLGIVSVCFKPKKDDPGSDHGRYTLASGGNDNYIKIWNFDAQSSTLELEKVVSGHSGNVLCLTFSDTGEFLGSSSGDKTAKIWETDHYNCLVTFGSHSRYVTCCAFSGDCKLFVTGCERSLSVWEIDLESKKKSGKHAFKNIAIHQWSSRDVKDWLTNEGFGAHLAALCPRLDSGPALLSTSLMVLTSDLGLDKEEASRLVQLVQWARFGGRRGEIEEAEIPDEFICPITCDVMRNPVECSDGFVYEESAIKEWLLTRRNTSPLTNLELKVVNLVPQPELLVKIREFVQEDRNRF